ncbi:hypothetical protein VCHA42O253_150046 [Vibrio chagasii]|nr:hypothetical protein VCHA42O253_150046 [Vibrio chagasii]
MLLAYIKIGKLSEITVRAIAQNGAKVSSLRKLRNAACVMGL